jgi:3-hydroxybutyryl-CoA dehydrogenase
LAGIHGLGHRRVGRGRLLTVVVRDIDDRALGAARERIEESLARAVKRGKVSDAGEVLERIELTTHRGAMRDRARWSTPRPGTRR